MSTNMGITNNNIFGVKHYKVKIIKKKENIFKYAVSVMSYALFIFLMLVGGTLLLYAADIKIRAAKGDYSAPMFNAYVVLSGSMIPTINIKDIVVTKKVPEEELEEGDIITFITPDTRYGGISVTHRIIGKFYDDKGNEITDIIPKWNIVCDFKNYLEIGESNNQISIGIDNDDFIDEEFKLVLSDKNNQYSSDLIIKIESLL